jgi:serine/threonine protein kinase
METLKTCPNCGKLVVSEAPQGLCPECLMKSGFDTQSGNEPAGGKPAFAPPPVDEVAKLFPQLEILELLGQGGMGAVYKARQPALNRLVALKVLPPNNAGDPGFGERFSREARALAFLSHPNIVTVYEFGQAGQMPYFIMEYVDGMTLRQVERSGKLAPHLALQYVMQICEALQFAHDEGVVHRDIKPENILIDKRGRVKIADFGIAKILNPAPEDLSLTGAKDVVGTAHYMAPEQLENPQSVDHRADIFSLGVVFYELLTGELPLGQFQPPSQKAQADARLDRVVLHALEKEPDRRYQKASQVKTDVAGIAATPGKGVPPVIPPARKWWGIAAMGCFGFLLLALVAGATVLLLWWPKLKSASPPVAAIPQPVTNASPKDTSSLLNADQQLVDEWTDRSFSKFRDNRTFDGWSAQERAALETRALDTLNGPSNDGYYQAINTLAALRSTRALPVLHRFAFERPTRTLHSEINNRGRWMSIRALGLIGDKTAVPELISLLYHHNGNVRWWAQISLVRLTGQNFGGDWEAWGKWWNAQGGPPPVAPEIIRWAGDQVEPEELRATVAEGDQRWLNDLRGIHTQTINDAFWLNLDRRNVQRYRQQLEKAPRLAVVRETHYDLNKLASTGIGTHYDWLDNRLANLCVTFSELVSYGYSREAVCDWSLLTRTEMPEEWHQGRLTNKFDVIATLRAHPRERLQAEIKKVLREQFGLAWHRERRDTDALVIRVQAPAVLQSKTSRVFADSASVPEMASAWENFFVKPVLDETASTNRYVKRLESIPASYSYAGGSRTKDLDANNAFLAQYGLELDPTNCPMEWLVMDHVKKEQTPASNTQTEPELESSSPNP